MLHPVHVPEESLLLVVERLYTHFQTDRGLVRAVDGVSFTLEQGVTLGLVGESGCGKTILCRTLMGLLPPSAKIPGDAVVRFDGNDLRRLSEKALRSIRGKDVSMIFQDPMTSLNPVMTVGAQISESLRLHLKYSKTDARDRSVELLQAVGIPAPQRRFNEYPHQLSGGIRQRVAIAIALACEPKLLIADEPTTALDVTVQAGILDLLQREQGDRTMSMILITHDLAVIAETCDRVIVMYGGVIQEIASIDELFKNPLHPYTKALMESIPKMDTRSKRLKALKGMVPSILELGDGCKLCSRFDPEECACGGTKVEPELIEVEKDHFARINLDILRS